MVSSEEVVINMSQTQLQVDLADAENIECEECENECFERAYIIKRISPLVSPTGQETLIPVPIFKCSVCGHINEKFLEGLTN